MSQPSLCIAVVDDDPSLRRSLGRLLRASGMQSVTFASAEAFLADARPERFDCLVLDVRLGGMSGVDLALWLRAEGNTTPIIFVTAYDDAETRGRAEKAGAAYFRKDDAGADVLDAIRRLTA